MMVQVFQWRPLSKEVAILGLRSANQDRLPAFEAGQNIIFYSSNSARVFSIASSPRQSAKEGLLEFFVRRENEFHEGEFLEISKEVSGDFTLARARGFQSVLFVATGTGIAPFVSMIRELAYGSRGNVSYTLVQVSREFEELGYYNELTSIAESQKLDLLYVPAVSRPTAGDWNHPGLGKGRAGNILRRMLHLSPKGEAVLPATLQSSDLQKRFDPVRTIILACGSHASIVDLGNVAEEKGIRFEKEDW